MITSERIKVVKNEIDAQLIYHELKSEGDFVSFARRFVYDTDAKVARNALWILTKASDQELSALQVMLHELMERAMTTDSSAVRRLSLNIVERLKMEEDDLRTDFLDFCLDRMANIEALPGCQSVCMKLAFRMCRFYPELMGEFMRTIEGMEIDYYKPAVKCIRSRIMSGKFK